MRSNISPGNCLAAMGDLGLMGMLVPTEYGGAGLSYYEYKMAIEELAKVCGSIGLSMAAHNSLCTGHILQFGNEEQKTKWLPKLASGEWIGAWGLTEANTGKRRHADAMCCTERWRRVDLERHQELDHTWHHRRRGCGLGANRRIFRQPRHHCICGGAGNARDFREARKKTNWACAPAKPRK